jgi:raffinose/stachyose/melibiose transport system substrate-binding protein
MKRKLALGLALLMMLSIVAGCKSTAKPSTSSAISAKLTYWTWIPTADQWPDMYKEFQAENPNITIDFWQTSNMDDYLKKLQVGMASGTGPDIFGLQPGSMCEQYKEFCEPMNTLADKYISDWKSNVVSSAVDQSKTIDGTQIGMPELITGQEYMLYNQTLMEKCGITTVPTTYAELVADSKKISAAGYVTMAMGAADAWHLDDWFVWASQQFGPGKIYDAQNAKLSWSDPIFVNTMNAWVQLFKDNIFETGALGVTTYPDARDLYFYAGKAVFMPTGTWHVGASDPGYVELPGTTILKDNDVIGMTSFPQVGPNPVVAVTGVDYILSVNKASTQKAAASNWVKFLTLGKGAQMWANSLQGSPVAKNIKFTATLTGTLAQSSIDYCNKMNNASPYARKLIYAEINTAIGVAMQDAATGKSVSSVLADVQKASDGVKR